MSNIEKYDKNLYPSIKEALTALIQEHKVHDSGNILGQIYSGKAFDDVSSFLCMNDIAHTFTVCPISPRISARVVMVCWEEETKQSLGWWEKTEKNYDL